MLLRLLFWAILITGSVAAVGCRSSRAQQTSNDATLSLPAESAPSDESDDDIADAHAHYSMGIIHELNDEPELALNEYYQAALKDPANESLVLEVSGEFLRAKQPEKALEIIQRAAAQPNASGDVFARLGFIYSGLNKMDEANKASRIAIQKEPAALAGYQNLFLGYLQSKQYTNAIAALDSAAKVRGTDADFLVGLAELYANLGLQVPTQKDTAFSEADAALRRARKLLSDDVDLRLRIADAYNVIGKDEEAAGAYRELLKEVADMPVMRDNIRAKLADIYLKAHDSKQATEQLQSIIRDNPTDAQAYYFLGNIAFDAKRYGEASDFFTKTILLKPDFEPVYYDLASAQLGTNKADEALVTLNKAREKFPSSFALEYLSAVAYSHQKDYTNAVNHFTAAEVMANANDPKRLNDIFYFEAGAACERAGDYAQAEKFFQKCLDLSPNFSEAQNYLGYMWVDHGEKLEQARALIEKAVKSEPKNAAYLDSLGWALFKLHQPKEALDYMLQAVKFSEEEDATLYDHLGEIYSALGQKDKAIDAWRKSVSLEKNDQVQKKLDAAAGSGSAH